MSGPAPHVTRRDDVTVIALGRDYENLDEHRLEEVSLVIFETAQNADPPLVVLDLSHTKFFGSAFIEIMFRAWNRLNARPGGSFAISGLTPYCAEVIETTHLDRLWPVFKTDEEAIRHMLARA
jgi:anti-anti-sigma factor